MTSVTLAIHPVHGISAYFDTAKSTLNPSVVGYPAYVYGTLPLFIVHTLAEAFGNLTSITLFGRQLSAFADLGTLVLLYFIVKRFYSRGIALLAASFSALSVMQIQQSHFYTTDNFATFFIMLSLLLASVIATSGQGDTPKGIVRKGREPAGFHSVYIKKIGQGSAHLPGNRVWNCTGNGNCIKVKYRSNCSGSSCSILHTVQ